jgi:hypothetical protein
MAYETLLVEVDLYSSPLDWNDKDYGHLSTAATWFHNLWNLTYLFNATLTFWMEDQVHSTWEHDRPLMSESFRVGYCGNDLAALNNICCFRNLIHLSDISKCNGITLDEFVVFDYAKILHLCVFLREEPLTSDFRLWSNAIHRLCTGTATLPVLLRRYILLPHIACRWFTTADAMTLYHIGGNPDTLSYTAYIRQEGLRMHYASKYSWVSSKIGHHPGTHYANITMLDPSCTIMQSKAPFSSPPGSS